jgi:hypothetical protein
MDYGGWDVSREDLTAEKMLYDEEKLNEKDFG